MENPASSAPSLARPVPYPGVSALAAILGKSIWIVDLEATTGDLKDPEFGVVEVGFVLVGADGSVEEDSYMVDPGLPMNPFAERLTGITRSDYAGKPAFEERWPRIAQAMKSCVVSGFGVHDLDCRALFMEAEKRAAGGAKRFPIDSLDARSLWRMHSGSDKGQLAEVAQAFGHSPGRSHRALEDARAAARALDGLALAMGPKACSKAARLGWNPLVSMDQAARAAEAAQAVLAKALAASAGCGGFHEGLAIMARLGVRPHLSAKGFVWWTDESHARWDPAPASAQALADHFEAPMPALMADPDSLARCAAIFQASSGPISDADAARAAMCRSPNTAAAARARSIRSGSLPPWSGVDPALAAVARLVPEGLADEREVLDAVRALARAREISAGHPAWSACSASIARERGLLAEPEEPWRARRAGAAP